MMAWDRRDDNGWGGTGAFEVRQGQKSTGSMVPCTAPAANLTALMPKGIADVVTAAGASAPGDLLSVATLSSNRPGRSCSALETQGPCRPAFSKWEHANAPAASTAALLSSHVQPDTSAAVISFSTHPRRASTANRSWQQQEEQLGASLSEKLLGVQLLAEAEAAAEEAMSKLSVCGCVQGGVKLPSNREVIKPELCFHEEGMVGELLSFFFIYGRHSEYCPLAISKCSWEVLIGRSAALKISSAVTLAGKPRALRNAAVQDDLAVEILPAEVRVCNCS